MKQIEITIFKPGYSLLIFVGIINLDIVYYMTQTERNLKRNKQ